MSDVAANPVLAEVIRSGFVESRHRGSVVAIAPDGMFAFTAGSANTPVFPRSSNKPLQAAAMLRAELPIDPMNGPIDALLADHAGFEGWDLRLQMPGGVVFVRDPDTTPEGGVVVAGGREQVPLSASGAEVLIALLEREQCDLDEIVDATGVDRTDAVAALRALARAELLGVGRTRP